MDKREEARLMWEESGRTMDLADIGGKLGIAHAVIRSWKAKDCWEQDDVERTYKNWKIKPTKDKAMIEELPPWKLNFCTHYLKTFNSAQAAWRTGEYSTFNKAALAGILLLKDPLINRELKRMRVDKREALSARMDDLVEMHMRIAFADITDFMKWGYAENKNRMIVNDSNVVDGSIVSEVSETEKGFKIKLEDKQKSLDFLSKYFMADPMDRHRVDYDNKRLALGQLGGNDDALKKLDNILEGIDGIARPEYKTADSMEQYDTSTP